MNKPVRLVVTALIALAFVAIGVVWIGGGGGQDFAVEAFKFGGAAVVAPLLMWLYKEYYVDDKRDQDLKAELRATRDEAASARQQAEGARRDHEASLSKRARKRLDEARS